MEEYQKNESVYGSILDERDNFSSSSKYAIDELKKAKDKVARFMKEKQSLDEKIEALEMQNKFLKKENDSLQKEKSEMKTELVNTVDIVF